LAALDVPLGAGGGEHDHGDPAQLGIVLELRQQLAAVHAREIQVQQDQVWPRRALVRRLAAQHRERLLAVPRDLQPVGGGAGLERLAHQPDIAGVVFHDEDVEVFPMSHAALLCRPWRGNSRL